MNFPFHDNRSSRLLSKVRKDISHLRNDMGDLLQHTTRHTLPDGARELAGSARQQLSAGGNYAAAQLRSLGDSYPRQMFGVLGGALLIGALAAGLYVLCKSECCQAERDEEEPDDFENPSL